MKILDEIKSAVHDMCKTAQAPGFVPVRQYYSGVNNASDSAKAIYSKIPQRYKDHALNTAVAAENGWWRFWNNVVPNTPVYLSQLAGGTLGGLKGLFQGGSSPKLDTLAEDYGNGFGSTAARVARALRVPAIMRAVDEGYKGYDAFGEIARNKWQKPARKWQDILYPHLGNMDRESQKMLKDLEDVRKYQAENGNEEAMEDFGAAKKLRHFVPLATGAATLGKVTNGFGILGNSK